MESCSRVSERERKQIVKNDKLRNFFFHVIDKQHGYFMYSFIDDVGLQKQVRNFVNLNQHLFFLWGRGSNSAPLIIQVRPKIMNVFNIVSNKLTKATTFAKAVDMVLAIAINLEFKIKPLKSTYFIDSRINSLPESLDINCVIITTHKRLPVLRQLFPNNHFYVPKYLECFYF